MVNKKTMSDKIESILISFKETTDCYLCELNKDKDCCPNNICKADAKRLTEKIVELFNEVK